MSALGRTPDLWEAFWTVRNDRTPLPVYAKLQRFIDDRLLVVAEAASNTKRSRNDDRAVFIAEDLTFP